jgi:hypothetical protein
MPDAGLRNGGWRVEFNDKPINLNSEVKLSKPSSDRF